MTKHDMEKLHRNYQDSGMNPFYSQRPEKSKKFLEKYVEHKDLAKYLTDLEDKQHLTKTDVDALFDKIVNTRKLADDYIPDQEREDYLISWIEELKEKRESERLDDVQAYYREVLRLDDLYLSEFLEHGLLQIGGPSHE